MPVALHIRVAASINPAVGVSMRLVHAALVFKILSRCFEPFKLQTHTHTHPNTQTCLGIRLPANGVCRETSTDIAGFKRTQIQLPLRTEHLPLDQQDVKRSSY